MFIPEDIKEKLAKLNDEEKRWILDYPGENVFQYINDGLNSRMFSYIENLIGNFDNKTILDLGCGVGYVSVELSKRGAETIGVDIDEKQIRFARAYSKMELVKMLPFYICDATKMPFPDGCFDLVVGKDFLEHVLDLRALAIEVYRILKPKGFCYFITPNFFWIFGGLEDSSLCRKFESLRALLLGKRRKDLYIKRTGLIWFQLVKIFRKEVGFNKVFSPVPLSISERSLKGFMARILVKFNIIDIARPNLMLIAQK